MEQKLHYVKKEFQNTQFGMNDNNFVVGIFLDFKKAFDSLDRLIFLEKNLNGTEF